MTHHRRQATGYAVAPREPRPRGQALVEFALIVPVLLLLLLVAIDFGRLFFSYIEVTNAAREAAAYVAADPTVTQASVDARAGQEANTQGQRGEGAMTVSAPVCTTAAVPAVTVSCATAQSTNAGTDNQVTVVVSRPFSFFTPVISGLVGSLSLTVSATSPVEDPPVVALPPPPPPPPDPCALIADFTFDQNKKNKPVTFTDQSSPAAPSSCAVTGWSWDFGQPSSGSNNTSTLQNPSHDYNSQNSLFTVTLTVTRAGGDTATFSQPVLTLGK